MRTWTGTVKAVEVLNDYKSNPPSDLKEAEKQVAEAIKQVSDELKNTPSVCRKCYIHPAVIDAYLNNDFDTEIKDDITPFFSASEAATMALLKRHAFVPH